MFLKIFLLGYFILYFGIAFVAKSLIVAKRIGKNPLVIPKDESAYGLIGQYFKFTLIGIFVYVVLFTFLDAENFKSFEFLQNKYVFYSGIIIMLIALIWTIIAQNDMRNSWRIGIDHEIKTELITTGLFRYSRNPIFFGMILSLIGLFFTTPNVLTLLFLIVGYVLIEIQIRLEEEFLWKQHGEKYIEYKKTTRRLL